MKRRDGDRVEQQKRRIGLHSHLHPRVLHAEVGDCCWLGHTVYSSCDMCPRQCLLCQ